jgi:signal peptidase I
MIIETYSSMTQIRIKDQQESPPILAKVLRELVETVLLALAIFVTVNIITARFKIEGNSMISSFQDGQYIVVNRLAYRFRTPARGDVVVFVPSVNTTTTFWENILGSPGQTDYIKRIVATPGDIVEIASGELYVNGIQKPEPYLREPMMVTETQQWQLEADQYLVLGDNRNFSKDSRNSNIGPVTIEQILGKVSAVYFPFRNAHIVK